MADVNTNDRVQTGGETEKPLVGEAPLDKVSKIEQVMNFLKDHRITLIVISSILIGIIILTVIIVFTTGESAGKSSSPTPLLWIRESAIIQISGASLPTATELIDVMNMQGASSVYFLNIIRTDNFADANFDVSGIIQSAIDANSGLRFITNVPFQMNPNNPYYREYTDAQLIDSKDNFNYSNPDLAENVFKVIAEPWAAKNVKGFLIENGPSPDIDRYVKFINDSLEVVGGSMANDIRKPQDYIPDRFEPSAFRDFLKGQHASSKQWSFYEMNPDHTFPSFGENEKRLVLIALYLFPGTPILNYVNDPTINNLLKGLSQFRKEDAFKFGYTYFPKNKHDVLAFSRVYEGKDAFAIALNFGAEATTVSFADTANIAQSGFVVLDSTSDSSSFETNTKIELNSVMLPPYGGKIIRF